MFKMTLRLHASIHARNCIATFPTDCIAALLINAINLHIHFVNINVCKPFWEDKKLCIRSKCKKQFDNFVYVFRINVILLTYQKFLHTILNLLQFKQTSSFVTGMGRMGVIKWEKATQCRPVHNIISSDFPKYNPQPWKFMVKCYTETLRCY